MALRGFLDRKTEQFAESYLDYRWPDDWPRDEYTLELAADWQADMEAAVADRWIEFRNRIQKARPSAYGSESPKDFRELTGEEAVTAK